MRHSRIQQVAGLGPSGARNVSVGSIGGPNMTHSVPMNRAGQGKAKFNIKESYYYVNS